MVVGTNRVAAGDMRPTSPSLRSRRHVSRHQETPQEAEKKRREKSCAALARQKNGAHPDGRYTHAHATPVSPRKTPDPPPGSAPVHLVHEGTSTSKRKLRRRHDMCRQAHSAYADIHAPRTSKWGEERGQSTKDRDVKLIALRRETAREVYPPLLLPLGTHVWPARNGSEVENRGMLGQYLGILKLEAMQVADGKLVAGRSK
ncbi:hypothetical protein K438DRAFT_1973272 [Mycena galopus ATCC 62051]|nr:hypothetical protein K438DRAFT_1973272 [Mycena galopus ATCC 62051]